MTNRELVLFAKGKLGTPYVYGMKGDILTEKKYEQLKILFGELVWDSDGRKSAEYVTWNLMSAVAVSVKY